MKPRWRFLPPLFLALFFLSLLSNTQRRAPWHEQWALNIFAPLTSLLSSVTGGAGNLWEHYIYLRGLSYEVDRLRAETETLRQKQATFHEVLAENERLNALLALKRRSFSEAVAAQVVALDPKAEYKSLRINKGSRQGILPDMPVVARDGLVGRVGPVFKNEAMVLLITDPASHVDVVVSRSRLRAILAGSGSSSKTELRPQFLSRLEYLKNSSDIRQKDWMITSGLDGFFPKGILVGEVATIEKNRVGIFLEAQVIPAVDFSELEEVLVLKRTERP